MVFVVMSAPVSLGLIQSLNFLGLRGFWDWGLNIINILPKVIKQTLDHSELITHWVRDTMRDYNPSYRPPVNWLLPLDRTGDTAKAGLGQPPELTLMVTTSHMTHTRGQGGRQQIMSWVVYQYTVNVNHEDFRIETNTRMALRISLSTPVPLGLIGTERDLTIKCQTYMCSMFCLCQSQLLRIPQVWNRLV